jgi:hypothetical protein
MNIIDAVSREKEGVWMTFTIDNDNNISAFATKEEAAASTSNPIETFASQKELAQLAESWPAERPVAIWNGLPGVRDVKGFKNAKLAAGKIWERIQGLGEAAKPAPKKAAKAGTVSAQGAKGAPGKGKATKKATRAPKPTKGAKKAKAPAAKESSAPREGSKTARVVAMLQRKNGATLEEIMREMGWQRHTVRGFMAGAMKKLGFTIESFKPEGGERTYRING